MSLREFDLHATIRAANDALPSHVVIPPGDDLAMINLGGHNLLAGVDHVIPGRHCRVDASPEVIGRKAMLRSLSDVAAMAARPVGSLASAALPPGTSGAWAEALHSALAATGLEFGAPLIGGDLAILPSSSSVPVISVTVLAVPALPNDRVVSRDGAAPGDVLAVTGRLGGSLETDGGGRHLDFPPRINEAIELATILGDGLSAMLDVSDGVGSDARQLIASARRDVRIAIDASAVPTNAGRSWKQALSDGEDYELLFTASKPPPEMVCGVPITVIGYVAEALDQTPPVVAIDSGMEIDVESFGWEHRS